MENKTLDTGMTQYEMRKQQYAKVPPLDKKTIKNNILEISQVMATNASYYMLLCNDRKDYTVFSISHTSNFEQSNIEYELFETLKARGKIVDMMDGIEKNSWEIWIRGEDGIFAYYLFDYTNGVIEI